MQGHSALMPISSLQPRRLPALLSSRTPGMRRAALAGGERGWVGAAVRVLDAVAAALSRFPPARELALAMMTSGLGAVTRAWPGGTAAIALLPRCLLLRLPGGRGPC